jgi:hypothetical protein
MASTVKGKVFYFGDAWTRNEQRARQLDQEEGGHYEGQHRAAKYGSSTDAPLGLDGDLFHMGGDRVTNVKEEVLSDGNAVAYFQNEHGGTFAVDFEKVGPGRWRQTTKPRRVHSF